MCYNNNRHPARRPLTPGGSGAQQKGETTMDQKYDAIIDRTVGMISSWAWDEGDGSFIEGVAAGIVLAINPDVNGTEYEEWDASDSEGPCNPDLNYVQGKLLAKLQGPTLDETIRSQG